MAFNPEFSNWFPVGKFRFWCQKVLPLVYDDSLSYYEVLCKVVDYLNKYGEDLGVLADEYKALVDYVNNYFDEGMPDVIQEYVNEWLDEHPEATTTVQDGAITYAKLDSNLKHIADRVVDTFDDLYNTTEDEVTVLKDDSYFGSGDTVTFMKSENELHSSLEFLKRANGDYMIPKPRVDPESSDVPAQAIGDVVASYINHPEIIYGGRGPFSTICYNEMDCSILTQLVYQGISYENSRYVQGNSTNKVGRYVGTNIPKNKGSLVSPTRTSGYTTLEQAMWFAQQNRLYYIDYTKEHPCSQLQVGDILFGSGVENGADSYLYIHHSVVVLAVYPDSDRIVVAQSGGSSGAVQEYTQIQGTGGRRDNIKITTLVVKSGQDYLKVFARPDYGKVDRKINAVQGQVYYNESATVQTSGSDAQLGQVFLRKPLNPHKMYTYAVKGNLPQYDPDTTNIEMLANIDGVGVTMGTALRITCGDVFAFSFVPPTQIADATGIRVRAFVSSLDDSLDSAKTYELTGFSLYEGLIPNAEPNTEHIADALTVESGVTGSRDVWIEDGKIHIHGTFALSSAVTSAGYQKVATLNPNYFGSIPMALTVSGGVKRFICSYDGMPHVGYVDASGGIYVHYDSGEGARYSTIFDCEL